MTQQRTSSIPVVKARLVDLLDGLFASDANVKVFYGVAAGAAKEIIVVGTTAPHPETQGWATIGDKQRAEDYGLIVFIDVDRGDKTQQAATERAFEHLAAIEDAVRDDVHLGLAGQYRSLEAQVQSVPTFIEEPNADGKGFKARVDTVIWIKSRI